MKQLIGFLSVMILLSGCMTERVAPSPDLLRVGISANAQPLIYKLNGQVVGVEADFANKIGQALGKEVRFIEVPWEKQIEYLEQNKTDIIMSGMTVTAPRRMRVNFTTPYLQSGLTALFRRNSYEAAGLMASTVKNQQSIGYVRGTTGEFLVMQRFRLGEKKSYSTSDAAVKALKEGKIDMFVYDAPIVWWLSAMHESDLVAFPEVLSVEPLAWGISKSNLQMLDQVNGLVDQWKQDGSSARIIKNWIPVPGQ